MTTLPSALHSIVSANSAVYHGPLTRDSIRLVELHPGAEGDTIVCTFAVVDLALAKPFEALSYCWGNIGSEHHIICNGQVFRPTENLYLALKAMRLTNSIRHMWIDAVSRLDFG